MSEKDKYEIDALLMTVPSVKYNTKEAVSPTILPKRLFLGKKLELPFFLRDLR